MRARGLAAWAMVLMSVSPSRADAQLRDGLASSLTVSGGAWAFRERALEPGVSQHAPDALRETPVVLDGTRAALGGMLRETLVLRSVRWSLGVGALVLPGDGARGQAADGLTAQARTPWLASFDLALGRQLRAGPVLPYVDLRASFHIVSDTVELRSPTQGRLSATRYQAYEFDLGPRLGVWIPVGSFTHIDLAARAGLWGPERFGLELGLGFYLPFSRSRVSG